MRSFIVGIVAIAGCAIGNAQSFDFHSLSSTGKSRYMVQNNELKESVEQEGARTAIPSKLPEASTSAAVSPPTVAPKPAEPEPQSPPVGGVMVGAACVLLASVGGLRHVLRRQAGMRAV